MRDILAGPIERPLSELLSTVVKKCACNGFIELRCMARLSNGLLIRGIEEKHVGRRLCCMQNLCSLVTLAQLSCRCHFDAATARY